MVSSLAPRGMQGDLVSAGLDALAHLRMHDGDLEPQKVSLLHLVAQLRMQDGKLESLVQGDIQSVNWKAVREALRVLPVYDHTVDWSDGSHFPWWVWLANTGVLRDVVNAGVSRVELGVAHV